MTQLRRSEAEPNDAQGTGRDEFQVILSLDKMCKQKGHLVIVRDRFGKTVATGRLDNSPDIQCTEAACALQCIFRQPRFMFILLWWSQAKGSAKGCAISHESTTAVYGN